MSGLTPRERDVAALAALGLPNKEIAYRLRISEETVKHHMSAILAKTELANRTELAVWWDRRYRGEAPADSQPAERSFGWLLRCAVCEALIWPWSRRGWLVTGSGVVQWWHAPRCSWVVTP